jgi:cytochrome P450
MIELCRDPDLQTRVRAELLAAFPVEDPTYEELASEMPLLDAVVHEVFRLHPPVLESWRTVRIYIRCSLSRSAASFPHDLHPSLS